MGEAASAGDDPRTDKYRAKYDAILDAAALLMNIHGAQGTTLAAVARAVGLNTTSVTYYFPRKDMLALACYGRAIDRLDALVAAAEGATPADRVRAFIAAAFADHAGIRAGERPAPALLSELRTLEEPERTPLMRRYFGAIDCLRGRIDPAAQTGGQHKPANDRKPDPHIVAASHFLMENMLWAPFWLERYDLADLPRTQARLADIVLHGLAARGETWAPTAIDISVDAGMGAGYGTATREPEPSRPEPHKGTDARDATPDAFLRAATGLINRLGYRGASVERIASELHVTKGSFYHHLDTKDDLVLACFRRSFATVARAQFGAMAVHERGWPALGSAIGALLDAQFGRRSGGRSGARASERRGDADNILMRATALQVLPPHLRAAMVDASNHLGRRFAGMLADGIADGSIRPVDTLIAAQTILASVNSAYDMRWWSERLPPGEATKIYGRIFANGIIGAGSIGHGVTETGIMDGAGIGD